MPLKNPVRAVDGDGLVWLYQPVLGMPTSFDALMVKRTDAGRVRVTLVFEQGDYVLECEAADGEE